MSLLPHPNDLSQNALPLRTGVGIMLINAQGLVWVGRRRPKWAGEKSAHIWQMPQGGIEKFEPPRIAALRELREETGVTSVEFLAEHPEWLTYELPSELIGIALKGRYRGQVQKWYAMRFTGSDSEIDIAPKEGAKAEFDDWAWVPMAEMPNRIVSFKRGIYEQLVQTFAYLSAGSASQ